MCVCVNTVNGHFVDFSFISLCVCVNGTLCFKNYGYVFSSTVYYSHSVLQSKFVSSILFVLNVLLCICHGMKFFLSLLWQIILLDLIDYAVIIFYDLE